jgi:DNA (cytosine-5)-methyltransferase 1
MTEDNLRRVKFLFDRNMYDLPNRQRPDCHRNGHSYKSMYGRLHWNKPAQTITTGFGSMGQGRFVHPRKPRMITPHEAGRVQGLPDFLDFSVATKRATLQALIGNAVPPRMPALVLQSILNKGLL